MQTSVSEVIRDIVTRPWDLASLRFPLNSGSRIC